MDSLLDFLKEEKPDIVTTQETFNEHDPSLPRFLRTVDLIKETCGLGYDFFDPTFKNLVRGYKSDRGNAIISRFPIEQTSSVLLGGVPGEYAEGDFSTYPIWPKKLQRAQIKLNGQELNVYNLQGIWGTDGKDTEERLTVSQKIIDEVKDKPRTILAGDFNVDQKAKSMTDIEKYLTNVFKDELISSFNMRRKTSPGYASAVVDFVFITPDMKVLSHNASDLDVSDHKPLICGFEV